jgi:DNA-binding transcriptional regulator YhcF (GntR family)
MKQPRLWKKMDRHPLSGEYPDIGGPAWQQFVADLEQYGIIGNRKVTLHEGKILDGWQMYRACVETNTKPTFQQLPKGMDPERFVQVVNDNRRHETQEVAVARAVKRRERVVEARRQGESVRTIAAQEGVSPSTVRDDLEQMERAGAVVSPDGGKVKGRDGRQQSAFREAKLCVRCQRLGKPVKDCKACAAARQTREPGDDSQAEAEGRQRRSAAAKNGCYWDWRVFSQHFGALVREIDRLGTVYKAPRDVQPLHHALRQFEIDFKAVHKTLSKVP